MKRRQHHGLESEHLLATLLQEAVPAQTGKLQPTVLLSPRSYRRHALPHYLHRTWFDAGLQRVEVVLGACVMSFFVWWLATGYGYDWWYGGRQAAIVAAASQPLPTQGIPTMTALPTQAETAQRYPELGNSLPLVVEPVTRRRDRVDNDEQLRMHGSVFQRPASPTEPDPPAAILASAPAAATAHHVVAVTPVTLVPTATPAPVKDVPATNVRIPSIDLDSRIVEVFLDHGNWQVAEFAVGHLYGTGAPGHGNLVLAGHKGIRGAVFRQLERVHVGDDIWIDAGGQKFHYRVQTTDRVWPNQIDILYPTSDSILTMLTCTNWDTQRFVVRASLIDSQPLLVGN
ncbi:MAG: sortase [Herpetosiphon sp.]